MKQNPDSEDTLFTIFRDSARAYPENLAIQVGESCYSYQDLSDWVDVVASALLELGCGSQAPLRIGLEATKSLSTYIGYLAILRLGYTVVPINVSMPSERLASIIRTVGIKVVLTGDDRQPAGTKAWQEYGITACQITPLMSRYPSVASRESLDKRSVHPAQLAYILFTSGSTGRPKGVPISHRNAVSYVKYSILARKVTSESRLSHTFDLTFDPSVFDLFAAWGAGATLIVPEKNETLLPVHYVNSKNITHWFSVPLVVSIARRLGVLEAGCMPNLRWSQFVGEQLTLDQANAWQLAAPNSVIENVYGPTELTVTCSEYRLPSRRSEWPSTRNGAVPIGAIHPNLEFFIANSDGHSCEDGELYVRGVQRFDGYLDPSDNISAFASLDGETMNLISDSSTISPDLWYRTGDRVALDGDHLVHLGRLDRQVKIRGRRIELGEIEAALRAHPDVTDSVVIVTDDSSGSAELRALCAGYWGSNPDLAPFLVSKLPQYMIPRRYFYVSSMPIGVNGKIDMKEVEKICTTDPK